MKLFGFGGAVCAVALSFLTYGCGATRDYGCSTSVDPALRVFVTDAATGAPAAANAKVTVTDGSYSETFTSVASSADSTPVAFYGAYERAGTYTIHVSRAGYLPAEQVVRVTKGDCHVNSRDIYIALTVQ